MLVLDEMLGKHPLDFHNEIGYNTIESANTRRSLGRCKQVIS